MLGWKSRYQEAELERMRKREDLLLSALLERAGHPKAAEILRAEQTLAVAQKSAEAAAAVQTAAKAKTEQRPTGRGGWRKLQKWMQDNVGRETQDREETANV
ncbi:MAG: hypothetical protein ACRD8A_12740 [Candidatus Acidiferrales bacterium]